MPSSPNMLLPGRGATLMPSRTSQEQSKYVFRPFPSTRYHPDGRVVRVEDAAEETKLCPESDGWVKTPFPPKSVEPAKPEMSMEQLTAALVAAQAELQANRYMFDKSWADLTREHDKALADIEALKAEITAHAEENRKLHAQLADTAPAAEGAIADTPAPTEAEPAVPTKKGHK